MILRPIATFLLLLLTASCSSNGSSASKDTEQPRLEGRLTNVKWDTSRRSSFEGTNKSVKTDKQYRTGADFRTTDYRSGKKQKFTSGKKEIKEGTFQGATKTSRDASSTFNGSDDQFRDSDSTFATSNSRFQNQENRNSGSTFRESGNVFRTRDEPTARKALETSNRPYMEQTNKPGYTEDEVKNILRK
ncbi:hypothetical protein FEM03_06670 [Phragmitibacter flavus]|uniref:Lipoprotein n=1 Tax=Phragmitibacter flavus TaxID=2576071 RepID=A0A5R8KHM3_9BACT|nr:hypothetical protein [Phragmitibacter flavus]TLD71813.1 hypothetical protein FEM03_06670 [Phragmitibacter flavus]